MRTLQLVLTAISALLVTFTVISGVWLSVMGSAGSVPGSHLYLAVAAAACVLATAVVTILRK